MPGSFKNIDKFTEAYIDKVTKELDGRLVAAYIREEAGDAIIEIGIATPDNKLIYVHTFRFDYSEVTHASLRQLIEVQLSVIDSGPLKGSDAIDFTSGEGLNKLFDIFEKQLLLYIPANRTRFWQALEMKLKLWSQGEGLKDKPNKKELQRRAVELLSLFSKK